MEAMSNTPFDAWGIPLCRGFGFVVEGKEKQKQVPFDYAQGRLFGSAEIRFAQNDRSIDEG
jgi:hypothetical protein